jgi:hypothetical protein
MPYCFFGLVVIIYSLTPFVTARGHGSLLAEAARWSLSGVLGSLWFWMFWDRWQFSVLHGSIWGCSVGLGAWRASRTSRVGEGAV